MPPTDLRPATAADLPRIQVIVAEAYTPWTEVLGQRPGPLDDDYAAALAAGHVLLLDPPDAGAALGLLILIPQPDALLLDNVALADAARGRGLGRLLLDAAEEIARARGFSRLRLYTHQKMTSNIALYAARGYAETHRVTEKGRPRVYMEKPLG